MELESVKSDVTTFLKKECENVFVPPQSVTDSEYPKGNSNFINNLIASPSYEAIDMAFIDDDLIDENYSVKLPLFDSHNDSSQPEFDEPDTMLQSRMMTTPLPPPEVDINAYQHKKTLAQGMMDLALLLANANQLRYVIESKSIHPYYLVNIILLGISISLQITVGIALIINSQYGVKKEKEMILANRINNFTLIGVFLITIVNVFISAFGIADSSS